MNKFSQYDISIKHYFKKYQIYIFETAILKKIKIYIKWIYEINLHI